jgi:hypothetical protein
MIISVAGVNVAYYSDVKKFYDKAISDPTWVPLVKLTPEPGNPYDPKAIFVTIDEVKIGYVAKAHQEDLIEHKPEVFCREKHASLYKWGKCGPDNDKFFIQVEI